MQDPAVACIREFRLDLVDKRKSYKFDKGLIIKITMSKIA